MKTMTINYVPSNAGSIEKELLAAVAKILEDHGARLSDLQFTDTASIQPKEIQLFNFMAGR